MGLYTPTILDANSYLSWFYDRGAIKDPAHTGTSKGLSQSINRGPTRKFLAKYAHVYVIIQSHALNTGARTHYVTDNGARNGLRSPLIPTPGLTQLLLTPTDTGPPIGPCYYVIHLVYRLLIGYPLGILMY